MYQAAKKAFEALYQDECTVTIRRAVKHPDTNITSFQEQILLQGIPCRISRKTLAAAGHGEVYDGITQVVTLYLAPDVEIPPGSRITVTRNGIAKQYCRSGEPMYYNTHQEVHLDLWKGWA